MPIDNKSADLKSDKYANPNWFKTAAYFGEKQQFSTTLRQFAGGDWTIDFCPPAADGKFEPDHLCVRSITDYSAD